jgi:hypothetical protein
MKGRQGQTGLPKVGDHELIEATNLIIHFAESGALSSKIAELEKDLDGKNANEVADVLSNYDLSENLLRAGFVARRHLGQINDLIHGSAISLVLETILEPGERIVRPPSLAAGNDLSRPYDLETDRRVAEFKLARWKGRDSARQRELVKDFAHLARAEPGKQPELFVLGPRPVRYLRKTTSSIRSQLQGNKNALTRFEEDFGDADISVSCFAKEQGAHVRIIDLEQLIPDLFSEKLD